MRAFSRIIAKAAPLPLADVNTDDIFPARHMTSLETRGLGRYLFESLRLAPDGSERPDFVLNQPAFRDCGILVSYANFGCGSSREHAVWSLLDYGIRSVIAPSFASIFSSNAIKNGLLLIELPQPECDRLMAEVEANVDRPMEIDLETCELVTPGGRNMRFPIDPVSRRRLLEGLDEVERTLRHEAAILRYEQSRASD